MSASARASPRVRQQGAIECGDLEISAARARGSAAAPAAIDRRPWLRPLCTLKFREPPARGRAAQRPRSSPAKTSGRARPARVDCARRQPRGSNVSVSSRASKRDSSRELRELRVIGGSRELRPRALRAEGQARTRPPAPESKVTRATRRRWASSRRAAAGSAASSLRRQQPRR